MKITHLVAVSLTLTSLFITAPMASAAPTTNVAYTVLTVDESGNPTSGVATFPTDFSPSGPTIQQDPVLLGTTNVSVGGGDWSYGWRLINGSTKECFSHYKHRSRLHSATASMAGQHKTAIARGGNWAKAAVLGGVGGGTCYAYWSNK